MEEAYNALPNSLGRVGAYLLPYIAEWKNTIGDNTGAYEAADRAYSTEPSNPSVQSLYLSVLDEMGAFSSLIRVLSDMHQRSCLDTQMSHLARFFTLGINSFGEIGRAYRSEGRPQFILEDMEKALDNVLASKDTPMKIRLQGDHAVFRYQYNDETDAAMRLLEQALKTLSNAGPTVQRKYKEYGKWCGVLLARLYFDAAVSARENGTNGWPYTKRLKQLATVTSMEDEEYADLFDFYGPGYASMLWGCWLRTYETAEEAMWKKTFKARLLDELNMLDDEDPSNDMAGLHALAITLLHLGDDDAAGAILAILFMPLKALRQRLEKEARNEDNNQSQKRDHDDDGDTDNREKDDANDDKDNEHGWQQEAAQQEYDPEADAIPNTSPPPHPLRRLTDQVEAVTAIGTTRFALALDTTWIHQCSGPCSTSYHSYTSLYICRICLGTKFCGDCLQLVKANNIVPRDCSPQHSWYQAWPIPEGKAEVAAECEEGKWIIRKEWLNKLRQEWI